MATDNLFQQEISKQEFFNDLERAKKVVDYGFGNYFILLNNTSFKNTKTVGGTTLSDIKSIYGSIYDICYFATSTEFIPRMMRIRDLTKADRKRLRQTYRFFPPQTYIAELIDPDGFTIQYPFKQNPDSSIVPLFESNLYRQNRESRDELAEIKRLFGGSGFEETKRIVELLPDLFDSLIAVVNYKGVDICIPIEKNTAKKTFKTRDKDGERRSHLIHNVRQFDRKGLKNVDKVKSHLRGTSYLTIDGVDVALGATAEWTIRHVKEKCHEQPNKLI